MHLRLNLRQREDSLTLAYGGVARTLGARAGGGEPLHQRLRAEVPLDLRLLCPSVLERAGRQLALLVLGRIGLGARVDQAPATSDMII